MFCMALAAVGLAAQEPDSLAIAAADSLYLELTSATTEGVMLQVGFKLTTGTDAAGVKEVFQARRQKMLSESINFADFLTNYIESYPLKKKQ